MNVGIVKTDDGVDHASWANACQSALRSSMCVSVCVGVCMCNKSMCASCV